MRLSEVVARDFWPHLGTGAAPAPELLQAAGQREGDRLFPDASGHNRGSLRMLASVAMAMRAVPEIVQVRPGAAHLVDATDLHSLPGEPPRLLRRAGIVEVARPEAGERLTGDLVGIGWAPAGPGRILLVVWTGADIGALLWQPGWGEEELELGSTSERLIAPSETDAFLSLSGEATRFLVALGLLLDAQGAPLREERERHREPRAARKAGVAPGWRVRHLYLADRPSQRAEAHGGAAGGPPGPGSELRTVDVRGHLRWQPYGPGRTERRLVWIESFESRRWVRPGPRRTVVH